MIFKIILLFFCVLPLSALCGDDLLDSWKARITLLGAGFLNAAFDFTRSIWDHPTDDENAALPEVMPSEEPVEIVEIPEVVSPEVTEVVNASEEVIILPQEPYERRYLPNGIDVHDEWAREVTLPTTDNNCAAFGIYGRNDVTRPEIVANLIEAARGNGDFAIHIRTLVAPEILGYLVDAPTDEIRQERMRLLAPNDTIFNILNTAWTNNDNEQLLKVLRNQQIFQNYLNNVVGRRLGDSEEDSYPELTLIRDGENLLGVIAAIAAQQRVTTLNIHQRINGQIIRLGTYNPHLPLTPGIQNRVVDLIHTTADSLNHPDALNHFNLLERCGTFYPVCLIQTLKDDPALYLQTWTVENDDVTAFVIAHENVKRWIAKLGLMCESSLHNLDGRNNVAEIAFLEIRNLPLENAIDKQIHFQPEINAQIVTRRWAQSLKQFRDLATGLRACTITLFPESILNKPLHKCNKQLHPVFTSLGVIIDMLASLQLMTPTAQRVQLLILIIDKTVHLYLEELKNRKNIFHQNGILLTRVRDYQNVFQAFQQHKLLEKNMSVEEAKLKLSNFYFDSYQTESYILIYMLEQLIDFCRINGYEPVVPHYTPFNSDIIKEFINDCIIPYAIRINALTNQAEEQAAKKLKGWTKKAKKKKSRTVQPKPKSTKPKPAPSSVSESVAQVHQEINLQGPTDLVPVVVEEPVPLMIEEVNIPERAANDALEAIVVQDPLVESVAEEVNVEEIEEVQAEEISEEEAIHREMRAKKERQKRAAQSRRSPNTAPSFSTLQWIGALLPAEQAAFEAFLLESMTAHERDIYNSFIQAENNALTLKEINEFASFIAKYLKGFLSTRLHINGERMYTDQAIALFITSIEEGHEKSEHNWHNPSGKKVDGSWIKYRYRTWIEHGIFEARGATRTDHTATAARERRLDQRQRIQENAQLFNEVEKGLNRR